MKFTISQSILAASLASVNRAIPSRPTQPILANIKVEALSDTIALTGFDLSNGIRSTLAVEPELGGELAIPAKLFTDIISKLPNEEIEIEADGELVTILSSCGKYQLSALNASDYPELPTIESGDTAVKIPANIFIEGIKGTLVACSDDETKAILTGVCISSTGDDLEFAATDGHRLGVVKFDRQALGSIELPDFEIIVPAKALKDLIKTIDTDGVLEFKAEPGQAVFSCDRLQLTTRTLDGKYPDYRLLLPKQFQRKLVLDRKELISALERISVFADGSNLVKFKLDCTQSSIELCTESKDSGSGKESIRAQIMGNDLELAFNIKYLLEGLKTLTEPEILININGALEPVTIEPMGGGSITYLIMPVQIRS